MKKQFSDILHEQCNITLATPWPWIEMLNTDYPSHVINSNFSGFDEQNAFLAK